MGVFSPQQSEMGGAQRPLWPHLLPYLFIHLEHLPENKNVLLRSLFPPGEGALNRPLLAF